MLKNKKTPVTTASRKPLFLEKRDNKNSTLKALKINQNQNNNPNAYLYGSVIKDNNDNIVNLMNNNNVTIDDTYDDGEILNNMLSKDNVENVDL